MGSCHLNQNLSSKRGPVPSNQFLTGDGRPDSCRSASTFPSRTNAGPGANVASAETANPDREKGCAPASKNSFCSYAASAGSIWLSTSCAFCSSSVLPLFRAKHLHLLMGDRSRPFCRVPIWGITTLMTPSVLLGLGPRTKTSETRERRGREAPRPQHSIQNLLRSSRAAYKKDDVPKRESSQSTPSGSQSVAWQCLHRSESGIACRSNGAIK